MTPLDFPKVSSSFRVKNEAFSSEADILLAPKDGNPRATPQIILRI
jgi:hypothetical protein